MAEGAGAGAEDRGLGEIGHRETGERTMEKPMDMTRSIIEIVSILQNRALGQSIARHRRTSRTAQPTGCRASRP
eukprot:2365259-Rhodomonas_salina.3